MKKYKSTGCARFFLFIIIFAPLAYFGAAYINGEDGVQKIKDLLGLDSESIEQVDDRSNTPSDEEKLREENERLKKELEELKQND